MQAAYSTAIISILGVLIGAGEFPENDYPFQEGYIADNDLALGTVVKVLSHSPYWKKMAIFITEDDPQGGVDHFDAQKAVFQR